MTFRDFDAEIAETVAQIKQLDEAAHDCMLLEKQIEEDLTQLEGDLATPTVALDKAAFKKCNAAIESNNVRLSTARRSMGAISTARGRLAVLRDKTIAEKFMAQANEYGRSAVEMAKAIDDGPLGELKEMLGHLLKFTNACATCVGQAGRRDAVYNPHVLLSLTFAQILRDAGLDVRVGEGIRTSRSNTDGYGTVSEALAEYKAVVETSAR